MHWIPCVDIDCRFYFFCNETGERCWRRPAELDKFIPQSMLVHTDDRLAFRLHCDAQTPSSPIALRYFEVVREESERLLGRCAIGQYILRPNPRSPDNTVLSFVSSSNSVEHLEIRRRERRPHLWSVAIPPNLSDQDTVLHVTEMSLLKLLNVVPLQLRLNDLPNERIPSTFNNVVGNAPSPKLGGDELFPALSTVISALGPDASLEELHRLLGLDLAGNPSGTPLDHHQLDRCLMESVKYQHSTQVVRLLLHAGADPGYTDTRSRGRTALHEACFRVSKEQLDAHCSPADSLLETVELLILAGANCEMADDWGLTPLHIACSVLSKPLAALLLNAGADPNAVSSGGEVPVDLCGSRVNRPSQNRDSAVASFINFVQSRGRDSEGCAASSVAEAQIIQSHEGSQASSSTKTTTSPRKPVLDRQDSGICPMCRVRRVQVRLAGTSNEVAVLRCRPCSLVEQGILDDDQIDHESSTTGTTTTTTTSANPSNNSSSSSISSSSNNKESSSITSSSRKGKEKSSKESPRRKKKSNWRSSLRIGSKKKYEMLSPRSAQQPAAPSLLMEQSPPPPPDCEVVPLSACPKCRRIFANRQSFDDHLPCDRSKDSRLSRMIKGLKRSKGASDEAEPQVDESTRQTDLQSSSSSSSSTTSRSHGAVVANSAPRAEIGWRLIGFFDRSVDSEPNSTRYSPSMTCDDRPEVRAERRDQGVAAASSSRTDIDSIEWSAALKMSALAEARSKLAQARFESARRVELLMARERGGVEPAQDEPVESQAAAVSAGVADTSGVGKLGNREELPDFVPESKVSELVARARHDAELLQRAMEGEIEVAPLSLVRRLAQQRLEDEDGEADAVAAAAQTLSSTSSTGSNQEFQCCVCWSRVRDILFIPCSHFVTCSTCSVSLVDCPLCRVHIEEKIFVAD